MFRAGNVGNGKTNQHQIVEKQNKFENVTLIFIMMDSV